MATPEATLDKYFDELKALNHFIHLSLTGLEYCAEASSYIEIKERIAKVLSRPAPFASDHERESAVRNAASLQDFAQLQKETGFSYLYELAAIKLWALLEAAVDDLVVERLRQCSSVTFPELRRIKGSLIDFLAATDSERSMILLERIKESRDSALKKGCGRFESLLDVVGLSGPVTDGPRRVLYELSEVRNVLVHRNATADRRFREACPWFGTHSNESVQLTQCHNELYYRAVTWYLIELDRRMIVDRGEAVPQDQIALQYDFEASILEQLAKQP